MPKKNTFFSQADTFNVKTFSEQFNINIIDSASEANWPGHSAKINKLRAYTQYLLAAQVNITAEDSEALSYLLAHSAWAVHFKKHAERFQDANELVALATQLTPESSMLKGYTLYVQSTIYRGNNKFQEALDFAEQSIEAFTQSDSLDNTVLAHTYNQASLAALRLKENTSAIQYGENAQECLGSTQITSFASKLLLAAEGDVSARTFMNLTQCYINNGNFQLALKALDKMDNCTQAPTSKDNAYRAIIRGECSLGLKEHNRALEHFNTAYQIYSDEHDKKANYLRSLLGMVTTYAELIQMGETNNQEIAYQYWQEAKNVHNNLKLKPEHDFSIRLDELSKMYGDLSYQQSHSP